MVDTAKKHEQLDEFDGSEAGRIVRNYEFIMRENPRPKLKRVVVLMRHALYVAKS